MDRLINTEYIRMVFVTAFSSALSFLTPTKGCFYALIIAFGFNIWAGMLADGVTIVRCKNFSGSKIKNAAFEMLLYLVIIEVIFSIMELMGDGGASLIAAKSLTYVFIYVYFQNAFRNLIRAYPTRKSLRIIYHVIRFEFKRAMPTHVQEVIDRIDKEHSINNKDNEHEKFD